MTLLPTVAKEEKDIHLAENTYEWGKKIAAVFQRPLGKTEITGYRKLQTIADS